MADTISTGGICPTATFSRLEQIRQLEFTTVDIETGLHIIEKLTKSDDCEALGDQIAYIVSRLYQHLDELHQGFSALRTSKEEAA
ncbi:MAG: hypothetical protein H6851_07525 [Geminicoccaceae bacterium]|nr:hypothetical protein [Geminicoccaceae bacterium]